MKRGFFIVRGQPWHNGHMHGVEMMDRAKDLDEIIIGIGTSQCSHSLHNPFSAEERRKMIKRSVQIDKPYRIIDIPDINDYPRWVAYVESLTPKFGVVYSGNTVVKNLFLEKGYEVRVMDRIGGISSTEIRQMMITGGLWEQYVPEGTAQTIREIGGVERLRWIAAHYEQPSVTADIIIDYKDQGIVYVKRGKEPFKGFWAFPGGHINTGLESIEQTAIREAKEETNLDLKLEDLRLLGVYSKPGRDPRGPYHTTAFYTRVESGELKPGDDAAGIALMREPPLNLAFDHAIMYKDYKKLVMEAGHPDDPLRVNKSDKKEGDKK